VEEPGVVRRDTPFKRVTGEMTMRNLLNRVTRKHLKRWGLATILFFVIFTVVGFFALPPLIKSLLVKKLSETLHREVTIQKIKFNPYTLCVTVVGFQVKERGSSEKFVTFDELFLNLQSLSALKRALILKEIRVKNPYINVQRKNETTYNFSDLTPAEAPAPKEKTRPFLFSLNNIQLENGSIDFWDGPKETQHSIRELNLGIPFLSNIPVNIQTFVQPSFSAKINDAPYALHGQTKPFADSRESSVDINIENLDIPDYLAYFPLKPRMKLLSAFLDAKVKVTYLQQKGQRAILDMTGDIALRNVSVDELENKPLLRLPRLDVQIASAQPFARTVHLSKIAIQSPELEIRRHPDGKTNLETLLPQKEAAPPSVKKEEGDNPFLLEIDELALTEGKVSFSDLSRSLPFKTLLSPIEVKVGHFSNGRDKRTAYALTFRTEANEEVMLAGDLSVNPLQGEGTVDARAIPLKKYSPYYRDSVLFDIEDGRVDLGGGYRYAKQEKDVAISLPGVFMTLRSLKLKKRETSEEFLKVPLLMIKDTEIDVTQREVKVGSFVTEKGGVTLNRSKYGDLDILKLLPDSGKEGKPMAPQGKQEKPWLVTLQQMKLNQYTVNINDTSPSVPTTILGEKVSLTGENLSTGKDKMGKISLSLLLDKKANLSIRTSLGLDPVKAEGSLEIKQLPLKQYSPYYQDKVLFDIDEGDLDLSTNYQYSKSEKDFDFKLSRLSAALKALRVKRKEGQEEFATIPLLSVKDTSLDMPKRELTLGEISTEGGAVLVKRFKNGELNLQKLLPPSQKSPEQPGLAKKEVPDDKPWVLRVRKFTVDQYRLKMEDEVPSEAVTVMVDEMKVKAENFSTLKGEKGEASIAFRLNQNGTVAVSGSAGIDPVVADLKVDLKDVAIPPLQGYFADRIKMVVTDGGVSATGTLTLANPDGKGLVVTYKGDSAVTKFASIDKVNAEDFLKWESLSLAGMNVGSNPLFAHVDGVSLANFYSRLIIYPDGSLNVQQVLEGEKKKEPPAAAGAGKAETASAKTEGTSNDFRFEKVTLQGGHVDFSDNHIKPNYSASLTEIGGRVSGLYAEEGKSADVELRGRWGDLAPMEIIGKINPLSKDLFVDLTVKLKDIELSPMTPYSGRYVGYTVEKGKLALDLKYLVVKRKLDSQNRIFFDQLTLGDRVESPEATKLPVKLAIALLKDTKGEIKLDLPVSGSLDDPKFSVFRVVMQIIGNLLVKAATSPFALLGAVFGGGEQLEYLEFDYGQSAIVTQNQGKVNTLTKILKDRPGIKLEIEAHVDMEKDKGALRQLFYDRKLKAQKLKEMVKQGKPAVPVDEVKVDGPEHPKYLKMAYKEEKFPKPKNFLGFDKDIPVPEMEKLMQTHIEIKEDDLRALAAQRAATVRDGILKGGIDPERIFLVQPKSLSPEKKEKLKDSRVNFKIK
jgi:uncharacterized protein involved in outer membrane biogenesis